MPGRVVVAVAAVLLVLGAAPARALFHFAVIDEVMSGANGDASIQYVEVRMTAGGQNVVGDTRLTVFDCAGTPAELLVVPGPDLANEMAGARWIIASPGAAAFLAAAGITPDRTWDSGVRGGIPTACGQVCWGAPGDIPPDPGSWDLTDPGNYVDCVAYGPYTGPTHGSAAPAAATPGDGTQSLTRTGGGAFSNAFALACPSPTNNAGATGGFGPCTPGATTTTTTTTPGGTTSTSTTLAAGGGIPLGNGRITLTSRPNPAKRRLGILAKHPDVSVGSPPGGADDPTVTGARLRLRSETAPFDATYDLPAAGWRRLNARQWRFRAPRGTSPAVQRAVLTNSGGVRVTGRGAALPWDLATDPEPVDVTLTVGSDVYCLRFGAGPRVRFKPGRRFQTGASPPPTCP